MTDGVVTTGNTGSNIDETLTDIATGVSKHYLKIGIQASLLILSLLYSPEMDGTIANVPYAKEFAVVYWYHCHHYYCYCVQRP